MARQVMRTMLCCAAAAIAAVAQPAEAAGSVTATINTITMNSSGQIFLKMDAAFPLSGAPACASSTNYHMVLDGTTATGQDYLAIALTARALQKSVNVTGTGDCSINSTIETLNFLKL